MSRFATSRVRAAARLPISRHCAIHLTVLSGPQDCHALTHAWSTSEPAGRVVAVRRETADTTTLLLRTGPRRPRHRPGQYVGIGTRLDGVWHWRTYSVTSRPDDRLLAVTVTAIPGGVVSNALAHATPVGTVLQAALNGSRPEDAHPALPVQARHLARDARAVARLGITSVHVHPRGPDTLETLEPVHVGDAVAAIRTEVPSMEIGVTTGRWIQPDPRLRIEAVVAWGRLGLAKPDFCSVNVHELGWEEICRAAASVGIGVELGVWTSGDAVTLRKRGIPPMTTRVLAESTVTDPDTAVAESVRILRALGKLSVPVLLHGEEGGAWPVLEYALRTKQDTRIGFEDVLQRPDGWLATGNDDLVRAAQQIRM